MNVLEGALDKLLTPFARLSGADAVCDYTTAILVLCNLGEVLDDRFEDDFAALLSLHESEALLKDVVATDVTD